MTSVVVDLERTRFLQCGLGQFCWHLGRHLLAESGSDVEPILLLPPGKTALFPARRRTLTAHPWKKDALLGWLRPLISAMPTSSRVDVWHVTHQDSKYWPLDQRIPVILTVHDLNFLREKSPAGIRRRLARLQRKVNRATVLTTGSEYAAREIREHLTVGSKEIRVIPHGVCLDHSVAPQRPANLASDLPFLFTIGDITPKKNFHVLVEMLAELPGFQLVVAGADRHEYAHQIRQRAAQLQLADRVHLPGRVSEAERNWLYQHCAAFVFPSLTEGFGLPLIESLAHGRPTFSSRRTSLPEVGGPWTFYWDEFDGGSMARVVLEGLRTIAGDPHFGSKQKQWVERFQWPHAAQRYLALYREVAAANRLHRHAA